MERVTIENLLFVGAGGFVGSTMRYALTLFVYRLAPMARLPWGTLVVNATGCLAIGFVAGLIDAREILGPRARLFVMIGVLGGFTTFSTFSYETLHLLEDGQRGGAFINIALQLTLGLGAVAVGYGLARLA